MNNIKFKIVTDSSSDVTYIDGVEFSAVPLKIRTNEKEFSDTRALCSFYTERGGLLIGFEDGKTLC